MQGDPTDAAVRRLLSVAAVHRWAAQRQHVDNFAGLEGGCRAQIPDEVNLITLVLAQQCRVLGQECFCWLGTPARLLVLI